MLITRTIAWLATRNALLRYRGRPGPAKSPTRSSSKVSTKCWMPSRQTSRSSGRREKVIALVDQKVIPYVDFQRMTASAVGRYWRQATPEQQKRLQEEFKLLLVRTYSGALSQVKDQAVELKPLRASPADKEVIVRTEIRGKGDPIQLDYRLEKAGDTGRSTTSMCLACGWWKTTATTSRTRSAVRHRRPDQQARRAQQGGGRK